MNQTTKTHFAVKHEPIEGHDDKKLAAWSKIAKTIAERYRHVSCKNHVFSRSMKEEVYDYILAFGVAKMKEKYDPSYGVLETTYLFEIMVRMAKAEYRRIVEERRDRKQKYCVETVTDPFVLDEETQRPCESLASVEREEFFALCSTVTDDEMAEIKRQYLPKSLRNLPDKMLQEKLSAIDRSIVDRLSQGEKLCDVRRDFEKKERRGGKKVDYRQFFENRRSAIIRRGKLREPKLWQDENPLVIVNYSEDGKFGEKSVRWLSEERERRQRRIQKRREAQKARRALKAMT